MKEDLKEQDFLPVKAIMVYSQKYNSKYYLEIHDVQENNNSEPRLSSGKPLNKSTMKDIIGAVSDDDESVFNKGLLNPMILSCEPKKYKRHIIWYSKPGLKYLRFDEKRLKHKEGYYSMPGLLYFVIDGEITIYALKGSRRPIIQTKLYHAPLYNLFDGTMCMGNVKNNSSKIINIDDEITFWENSIWNSQFNSDGNMMLNIPVKDLYKQCYNSKKAFPSKELVDTGKRIYDLIDKL